jgi:hypothetical protein
MPANKPQRERIDAARHFTLGCCATVLAFCFFSGAGLWAQTPDSTKPKIDDGICQQSAPTPQTELPADKQQAENSTDKQPENTNAPAENVCTPQSKSEAKGKQTKRLLWIVPNFGAVSANTELPPLSVKGKFRLAFKDSFDYSSFVWTGIIASQEFGLNDYPEFGHGAAAYGRYYWHNYADTVSGAYFTQAIVPSITHEDPRYYTLEHGNAFTRVAYALSRLVVTKTDSGGTTFNLSQVGGNAIVAGLSEAYYPAQARGLRQFGLDYGAQIESVALGNIAVEFWPDIRHKLLRRK